MKKILALFLAVVMMGSVAGCGGNNNNDADQPQQSNSDVTPEGGGADSGAAVTLKFANYGLLEQGYTEFWEGVKEGFEDKYPHITIEWVTAPFDEISNQVINMAGGGDFVDIIFGEGAWASTFEDAGLAAPLNTILTQEFLDDFYPNSLKAGEINGEQYAIPLYISPFVLYYNKDIFEAAGLDPEKPPATYEEMLQMAEIISEQTTEDGNKIYAFGQTTASVSVSGSALTAMLYNFGATLLNEDGQLSADSPEFKETFEMVKLLDERGYNPQNAKLKDLRNLFALGQLAMYYDQSWGFNGVQSINPDAKDFTASAPPLAGGSGSGDSILQAHAFILVDNGEARKEAVRLLVEYIITEEVLSDYMANKTPAYPARNAMSDMDTIINSSILSGAASSMDKAQAATVIPTMSDLNLELCTLAQAITVSNMDVDQAIETFKNAAQSIINQ